MRPQDGLLPQIVNAAIGSEVLTLSLLGIVTGAMIAFPLTALFRAMVRDGGVEAKRLDGDPERVALPAAALAMVSPLIWVTAARPLSDVPGLAAALLVQSLLVR